MDKFKYIASCNFTLFYPELSRKVQDFMQTRSDVEIIRCCTDRYKVKEFEDKMAPEVAQRWKETKHYSGFNKDITMISVCQNCISIFQESQPDIKTLSLWEYILCAGFSIS